MQAPPLLEMGDLPDTASPRVYVKLSGWWKSAELHALEQLPPSSITQSALDGACSFPGCILCEKHHGPHEMDAALINNPTPKRKAGAPTKFVHTIEGPQFKSAKPSRPPTRPNVAHSCPNPTAATPPAKPLPGKVLTSGGVLASGFAARPVAASQHSTVGLPKRPPPPIAAAPASNAGPAGMSANLFESVPSPDLPPPPIGVSSSFGGLPPGVFPKARKTASHTPSADDALAEEAMVAAKEEVAGGGAVTSRPAAARPAPGFKLTSSMLAQRPLSAERPSSTGKMAPMRKMAPTGKMAPMGKMAPTGKMAEERPTSTGKMALPDHTRVYVRLCGWWETPETIQRNRLWALEGMCNFPGCPLKDRHSGPHQFCEEAAELHK